MACTLLSIGSSMESFVSLGLDGDLPCRRLVLSTQL